MFPQIREVWTEPVAASSSNPPCSSKVTGKSQWEGWSGDTADPISNKRQIADGTARYPRKRGTTACQLCRVRKTKCDNARPACASCIQHKANCVYGSSSEANIPFDAASEEILSRLSAIQSLLSSYSNTSPPTAATTCYEQTWPTPDVIHQGFHVRTSLVPKIPSDALRTRAYSAPVLSATRSETLLKWQVFEDVLSAKESKIESFLLDWTSDQEELANYPETAHQLTSKEQHQLDEADYVSLCHTFLCTIHRRSPILDGDRLMEYAEYVMEHGLGWDTRACLVLLASALAHCGSSCFFHCSNSSGQVGLISAGTENRVTAEAFYIEAKKRIGFLNSSITSIQCLFLASMYEKANLNIIKAWDYIKDACSRLQTYLVRRRWMGDKQPPNHLEPRIFWSCMKAESELVVELPLQSSGIGSFEYPYLFPKPPPSLAKAAGASRAHSGLIESKLGIHQRIEDEEESWFFYTADISFRRILNQHLEALYIEAESGWMEDINSTFTQFTECEKHIEVWYRHLPLEIHNSFERQENNDLSLFLKGRFLGWRELVRRPFLYYAVHHSISEPPDPRVIALATECLEICANLINHYYPQGRHGGTWFISRKTFTCSLLILTAVIANRKDLQPPENWLTVLQMAIDFLERSETEASDIARMRALLCKIVHWVCQKLGAGESGR